MRGKGKRENGAGTVKQLPNGRWKATYTVGKKADGRLIRKSVNGRTKDEALKNMRERQDQLRRGYPVTSGSETVGHYLERWLVDRKRGRIRDSTYIRHANTLRSMEPHIGHLKLNELHPSHIQAMFTAMEKNYAPSSIQRVRAVLHHALEGAVEWELIGRNPAKYATPPAVQKIERRIMSREEGALLFAEDSRWQPLWILLATLGLRISEALSLTWEDWDGTTLTIRSGKTEAASRTVPTPATVIAALKRRRTMQLEDRMRNADIWYETRLIFSDALGREIHRSTPGSAFTLALKQLGLPHMRLHDLRRTAIVWMREAGVELDVVQAIVGHAHVSTTIDVYGTVNHRRLADARRSLDEYARSEA